MVKNKLFWERIPKIDLIPFLEDSVINTSSQKSYNQLMQVFEVARFEWFGSWNLPTSPPYEFEWKKYKKNTCIDLKLSRLENNNFKRKNIYFISRDNFKDNRFDSHPKIIQPSEFYKYQGITPNDLEKLEDYFKNLNL